MNQEFNQNNNVVANNKKGFNPIIIVILVLLVAGVVLFFVLNKKENNKTNTNTNSKETNITKKDGTSCGDKCVNYDLTKYTSEVFKVNYKDENVNFNLEFKNDAEKSYLLVKNGETEVYKLVGTSALSEYVKVYAVGDYYVVEHNNASSTCKEVSSFIFTKTGEPVGVPAEREFDDVKVNYGEGNEDEVTPPVYKVEFDGTNIVAYKKVCGFCENNSNAVGYKYNMTIDDSNNKYSFKVENKTPIYCSDVQ